MKFQIGDKVNLIYSNEEAIVVDRINETMALVNVGGVTFPCFDDQMEYPYLNQFLNEKKVEQKQKTYLDNIPKEKHDGKKEIELQGVGINFLPVYKTEKDKQDEVELLKISLYNGHQISYYFSYCYFSLDREQLSLKSELLPRNNFYLHDLSFEALNDRPIFEIEFSLTIPDSKKQNYFFQELKLKPKQVFKYLAEIKEGQRASFNIELFEEYPEKKKEKIELKDLLYVDKTKKPKQEKPSLQNQILFEHRIDLHIEKIDPVAHHLSNFEILAIQLNAFEKFYNSAIKHRQKYLVVIHGLGEGVLRDNIHSLLKQKPEVDYFVNQYHPLYGHGATEVYLKM